MKKVFQVRLIDSNDGEILSTSFFEDWDDAFAYIFGWVDSELPIVIEVCRKGVQVL